MYLSLYTKHQQTKIKELSRIVQKSSETNQKRLINYIYIKIYIYTILIM